MSESERLLDTPIKEPADDIRELEKHLSALWKGEYDLDVVKRISDSLRSIEGAVVRKYEKIPPAEQKKMNIGDLGETLDAVNELQKGTRWVWRFPALMVTVVIACGCIPLASALENVIVEHPVLGGFPPAISAAAGCIGIQNTAIIIRALGVKLLTQRRIFIFLRYCMISGALALAAAIVEAVIAWIVVSVNPSGVSDDPYSLALLLTDVPIVIFFAMFITGSLAGIIGAGVPLLVDWVSFKTKHHFDPAHWVGPIETVVQELSAAMLTFWIADTFVFA